VNMVERSVFGVVEEVPGVCTQCGKSSDFITLQTASGLKRFCTFECQLRSEGKQVMDGELDAILNKRIAEYKARGKEHDAKATKRV